jgi:holin-like protein
LVLVIVKHVLAFVCLVAFFYFGNWLQSALSVPLPGVLIGLILLFLALLPLRRTPASLLNTGQFLLKHLSLFFIPAILSIFLFRETLQQHLVVISVVVIASTLISLVASALICHFSLKGLSDD